MLYDNDKYWDAETKKALTLMSDSAHTSIVATFGGWTYTGMWDILLDSGTRDTLARNIVALMAGYYGPVWSTSENRMTYIQTGLEIDGVDFDFERQTRISPELNDAFVDFIKLIREYQNDDSFLGGPELTLNGEYVPQTLGLTKNNNDENIKYLAMKEKTINVTMYHVGADPVECGADNTLGPDNGCSFVTEKRSIHHGETVRALKELGNTDLVDGWNIMLYDAGTSGTQFYPNVAIDNYKKYIPADKLNGGITIKSQWGPDGNFVQSMETNKGHIQLFRDKGLNGFFTWSIGGVPATSSQDFQQHTALHEAWEFPDRNGNKYEAQAWSSAGFSAIEPGTTSVSGQDHSVVSKDGKLYVVIGGTWYESGILSTNPSIEKEVFTRDEWPGYSSPNRVNYLCKNGERDLNAVDLLGEKDYLHILTRNGRWCKNIDLPQASEEMKGKVIDIYRKSAWKTFVNGKAIPQWRVTRYIYK